MALPVAAIPYIAGGLSSLFGIGQKLSAARMDRNNPFQARTVNSLIASNAAQAQNQARIGIAEQQYQNARNQQQQNLATILGTASRSGRNIPLGGLLRQSNLATQQLNTTDAQARQQNQRYAAQQNQILAQEQQNVRSYNIEQPYMRRQQQAAELRNAGNQNIFAGLGMAAQSAIMTGGAGQTGSVGANLAQLPTNNISARGYTPNFFNSLTNRVRSYGLPNTQY